MGERNDKDDRFSDGPPRGDRRSVAALRALTGAGVRVLRPVVRVTGIGEVTERILLDGIDAVLRSSLIEEAVDRALARGVADQVASGGVSLRREALPEGRPEHQDGPVRKQPVEPGYRRAATRYALAGRIAITSTSSW